MMPSKIHTMVVFIYATKVEALKVEEEQVKHISNTEKDIHDTMVNERMTGR